jgi:murein DD-endopeptidase MepM/ murein hydrolase activator NlpD
VPPTAIPTLQATSPPSEPVGDTRYNFPVEPGEQASYGPCHHDYSASDIFTPIGSGFVAPINGVVDWISFRDEWQPEVDDPASRGGLAVAIIGADGVRYYGSHLLEIAPGLSVGQTVSAGQLLGLTGKSGNAATTAPHLHFGISHPTTPDDWAVRRGEVNPYPYLNLWREGTARTPDLSDVGGGVC